MNLTACKKVVIITEANIEKQIVSDLKKLGVSGYTAYEAWGDGSRGARGDEWEDNNVKMEVICTEDLAGEIFDLLEQNYDKEYGIVMYTQDVQVHRIEKFSKKK